MCTYTIGEVAARSGFSTSSLRYYEGIGLVEPVGRTDAGYRLYDDHTSGRLAFIARAKQLGCSLGEITDLVAIWDGQRCAPVQRRFHELVTDKIAEARDQVAELTALVDQLHDAAAQLAGPAMDGPCGDGCACLASLTTDVDRPRAPVRLVAKPDAATPIACTLEAGAMPGRLADWRAVLDRARGRTTAEDGALRVAFAPDIDLGELARLVAAEQQCCSFFGFTLTIDDRGIALEVRAPDGAQELVASLFGDAV